MLADLLRPMRDQVHLVVHAVALDQHLGEAVYQVAEVTHTLEVAALLDVEHRKVRVFGDGSLTVGLNRMEAMC